MHGRYQMLWSTKNLEKLPTEENPSSGKVRQKMQFYFHLARSISIPCFQIKCHKDATFQRLQHVFLLREDLDILDVMHPMLAHLCNKWMDGCPQIICLRCEKDRYEYDHCSFHQAQHGYPPCNAMIWISVLPKLTWMISFSEWCNATTLASVLRLLQICHVFAPTLFVSRAGLGL